MVNINRKKNTILKKKLRNTHCHTHKSFVEWILNEIKLGSKKLKKENRRYKSK